MDDTSVEPLSLSLLREITNGFSEERKLGSGSFGEVYEGVYQDGKKIAVKMLRDILGLDHQQFQNEFNHLARLQHQNIVQLVGYCHDIQEVQVQHEGKWVIAERTRRALCLEYMSNGSLEKYLSDECDRYDWYTCYRIIKGICKGLKYLHNDLKPPIYHLDLKPANILLDENMVPRIADFGTSRLFGDDKTRATQSSLGTHGYAPPEFIRNKFISSKFDIFSLGVVIIKMMAGHKGYYSIDDTNSEEFTNLVQEKWTNRLLGTWQQRTAYSEQVKICIQIGLSCVKEDRKNRPTIQEIVCRLEESETKCNSADRKNRLSIVQEVKRRKTTNTSPVIDGFKIVGDSRLGSTLKACGVPTHYKFQWIRCLEHGNTQPIEGATTSDYMVTADDLGTLLAVDCTPVDKDRHEGNLVRVFADSESEITCGEGIPPLSQQQPTVPVSLQRGDCKFSDWSFKGKQSISARFMFGQEPYQESGTTSGSYTKFHLRFLDGLKTPIYTEKIVTSESDSAIRIGIFVDGNMVRDGPLSTAKVEMLVLRGDFCSDGRESWTEEEFNSYVVQGRHGQGSVLGGVSSVWLKYGEASFGAVRFKEGSSRTPSRMFVVGARICMDIKIADRVQEAVMQPVTVLGRRNEANEKRYPPELDDEVYRLEEISKNGTYHKRLIKAQISTVQDFLKAFNKDANKFREEVLQLKKRSSSWEKMFKHARECCLTHELKAYHDVKEKVVIFLNCVHDLVGAIFNGVYLAQEYFDPTMKALVYKLKDRVCDQLDSLPVTYVMNRNDHRPELIRSSTPSSLKAANLSSYEALEGEGIPPLLLSQQQPTALATPLQWDGDLPDRTWNGDRFVEPIQIPGTTTTYYPACQLRLLDDEEESSDKE